MNTPRLFQSIKNSNRHGGFTLLELLIVIAIILILVAIALPNFLDAQIRAKVTHSEAQMRSLGLALESYRTDWPRYPAQAFYELTPFNAFPTRVNVYALMQLTTPVPYMERVPIDIFFPEGEITIFNDSTNSRVALSPPDRNHRPTYLYWSQESLRNDRQLRTANAMKAHGINWALISLAPDGDLDTINLDPDDMAQLRVGATSWNYSPTNGTKSSGDLSRVVP